MFKEDKERTFKTDGDRDLIDIINSYEAIENPEHMLLEGDNLDSLAFLKETHKGKINIIYIDPPYNLGHNDFIYKDKRGHEGWSNFMRERLASARELMSDSAAIFISIDDNEFARLRLLCDSVFGEHNFVTNIIWQSKAGGAHDSSLITTETEYVLVFAKDINKIEFNKQSVDVYDLTKYKHEDKYVGRRGRYLLNQLDRASIRYSESLDYKIDALDGSEIWPGGDKADQEFTWRWSPKKVQWGIENDFIEIKKNSKGQWKVYSKQYQFVNNKDEVVERVVPYRNLILDIKTKNSDSEYKELFGNKDFVYPKPVKLIEYLVSLVKAPKNTIILDFFAGTGTTGLAVLSLNRKDRGSRKFILCTNNENGICTDICYPRIISNMEGYISSKGTRVNGIGGTLRYYKYEN